MAIQSLADYDLNIAEIEAKGIEREPQMLKSLGSSISSGVQGALRGAEVLKKRAIEEQKDQDVKKLLEKGVQGVNQYSSELGFDPNTSKMFRVMAESVKDPSELPKIYGLQNQKYNTDQVKKDVNNTMMNIQPIFKQAMTSSDPEEIAKYRNQVALVASKASTKEARDEASKMVKMLDNANKGKFGSGGIGVKDKISIEDRMSSKFEQVTRATRKSIEATDKALTLAKSALKNPKSLNTSADVALIMSFNKLLDEGSVVREGEYDRIEKAQGGLNYIKGLFNSMTESGGAKLTDDARKNIVNSMEAMKKLSELTILERGGDILSTASARGLRLRSVAGDILRKYPEESKIMLRAFSDNATPEDKQEWQNMRDKLILEADYYADKASKSQGATANYTGPNVIDKVSKQINYNKKIDDIASEALEPVKEYKPKQDYQQIGRFKVRVK